MRIFYVFLFLSLITSVNAQFTDCYEESNWIIGTNNTGPNTLTPGVVFNNNEMVLTADGDFQGLSTNMPAGFPFDCSSYDDGIVKACITIPTDGTVSFDWNYTMQFFFEDPANEPFGYCLNSNNFVSLITAGDYNDQSGTASIEVTAGDELCIVLASYFSEEFQAVTTVSNFSAPVCEIEPALVNCYAEENWSIDTTNVFPGTVQIDENSMVIINDMDFMGSNLDSLDCGATDGMTSVCITIPSTGNLTFDWSISTPPWFSAFLERFGYCHNGVSTTLNSEDPFPWGTNSGITTVEVEAGDEFCFVYASKFADGFNAPVTIDHFFLPECPAALAVDLELTNSILCFGENTATIQVNVSGGVEAYSYEWDNVLADGNNPMNLPADDYCVTITDAIGGTIESCITITEPSELTNTISSTPETEGNVDGTATVIANGGVAPYSYSWNTNPEQTTSEATNLSTGTYSVTITDANGCENVNSIFVEQSTGVSEISGLKTFEMYPNPSNGNVFIGIEMEQPSDIKIELYNSLGQRVNSLEEKSTTIIQNTFEWSGLPKGTYWLSLSMNNERTTIRLILH